MQSISLTYLTCVNWYYNIIHHRKRIKLKKICQNVDTVPKRLSGEERRQEEQEKQREGGERPYSAGESPCRVPWETDCCSGCVWPCGAAESLVLEATLPRHDWRDQKEHVQPNHHCYQPAQQGPVGDWALVGSRHQGGRHPPQIHDRSRQPDQQRRRV